MQSRRSVAALPERLVREAEDEEARRQLAEEEARIAREVRRARLEPLTHDLPPSFPPHDLRPARTQAARM